MLDQIVVQLLQFKLFPQQQLKHTLQCCQVQQHKQQARECLNLNQFISQLNLVEHSVSGLKFINTYPFLLGLSFSTTGIDSTKPSNAAYLTANSKTSTALDLSVSLRSCIVGESFSTSGAWVECAADTSYSLSALTSPGDCETCQTTKMYWKGGSDIGPKPGYWRSANTTDNFIACLNSAACLGYVSPTNNNLGEWENGYQGILCADWEVGYSREGTYQCGACPNAIWNVIRLTGILIAVLVGIVFMIKSTLNGALQRKNIQSVYIKILMNHLQLIYLTSSFDFDWPDNVVELFEASEPVAQVSQQILSFDWFLDQRTDSSDANTVRLFYQKMIMYALLPLLLALGSVGFWYIYYWCRKSADKEKRPGRIMATVIILFFLVHPTIVQYMFSNFK